MKTKIIIALLTITAFVFGIAMGQYAARRNVITYSVPVPNGEFRNAVHMDWPTYGLPIAEYQMFLTLLDSGDTNGLRQRLDLCLDTALFDSAFRRPALPDMERARLDKVIAAVAKYRTVHPRSNTLPKRDDAGEQLPQDGNSYWSNQHDTVDALLKETGRGEEPHNNRLNPISGS